jgi:hypothetical protein
MGKDPSLFGSCVLLCGWEEVVRRLETPDRWCVPRALSFRLVRSRDMPPNTPRDLFVPTSLASGDSCVVGIVDVVLLAFAVVGHSC